MKLSFTRYDIQCTHPFGISRSTHSFYRETFIYLEHNGLIGRGEASPSERYGESAEKIMSVLQNGIQLPENIVPPEQFEAILLPQCGDLKSLEAAFSMAYLDLWTKIEHISLNEYFDIQTKNGPLTSFTIAMGNMDLIAQKIDEAEPYQILKVKLGTDQDKEIIQVIRGETDKCIRVDANEGWDLSTAIEMCSWLADRNIELIEQPLPAGKLGDTAILKKKSPLPLIADENCLQPRDILRIAHAFDGINIKLMKCGSLLKAKQMIDMAKEREMSIMLGCMIESSVGITAAAHLSPLVDYADLDGNLLIKNDPYIGIEISEGAIIIPRGLGLGVNLSLPESDAKSVGLK